MVSFPATFYAAVNATFVALAAAGPRLNPPSGYNQNNLSRREDLRRWLLLGRRGEWHPVITGPAAATAMAGRRHDRV
jgi:hypothetical protein